MNLKGIDTCSLVACLKTAADDHLAEPMASMALESAIRLETLQKKTASMQREIAFLRFQRDKAIRALMAIECPTGAPSCPLDMEHLDNQWVRSSDRIGFGCVHKKFDGQCPLEQTESEIFDCWTAWLEGKSIG